MTKEVISVILAYRMGQYRENEAEVFPVVLSDGTGGNRHKLQQGKSQLSSRRIFFSLQIAKTLEEPGQRLRSLYPWKWSDLNQPRP